MAATISNLRVLDSSATTKELDLVSELFHRINRIIPQDQKVLTIPPTCKVRDAISLMKSQGYSQVPVVKNGEVLGVFSFRSFAHDAAKTTMETILKNKCAPGDLTVDEYLEDFQLPGLQRK